MADPTHRLCCSFSVGRCWRRSCWQSPCSPHAPSPSQDGAADLGGTSWQLVKFQGSDDKMLKGFGTPKSGNTRWRAHNTGVR